MSAPHEEAALARVPDLPQWIDTRGMLLTGRALVTFPPSQRFFSDGFVVELASRALLSAIGNPPAEIVAERACAMQGEVNVLCGEDTAETVGAALPSWIRRGVRLFALPGVMPWNTGTMTVRSRSSRAPIRRRSSTCLNRFGERSSTRWKDIPQRASSPAGCPNDRRPMHHRRRCRSPRS